MATAEKQAEHPPIKSQGRSASYPFIDLQQAEVRVKQFWDKEKTNEAPVGAAFAHWGYAPKSSGARLTIAALLSYGLLVDRGANENRMVKLSRLGVDLIMAPNPEAKLVALKQSALKPRVFAELLKTIDPEHLPSDQTLAHTLVTQKGFNPSGAESFIKNFNGTVSYAKLKKSDILPVAVPSDTPSVNTHAQQHEPENLLTPTPQTNSKITDAAPATSKGFKQDVYHFVDGGQVILQWPEGMSKENFEEFEDWIKLELRKIARAVKPQQSS